MRSFKRRMRAVTGASVIALAGVMLAGSPAYAATSSSCTAPYFYSGAYRTCTTGSVSANPTGHFVDVHVSACTGSPWKVWDTQTGVTVATGKGSVGTRVIWGLYGSSYKAKLTDACANDWIQIESLA